VVFGYNRVYCDVERLPDEDEVMYPFGRGFYYTKTDKGLPLRDERNKTEVKKLYDTYHKDFEDTITKKLKLKGSVTIIDCHSFSDTPFESDLRKDGVRPDICLGTDDYHTPRWLVDHLKKYFETFGYVVAINYPYSGCIVPLKYYRKDKSVRSIMIEVNRKLFTEDGDVINDYEVLKLNKIMTKIF
jgi:N-formylglutamate deformylase